MAYHFPFGQEVRPVVQQDRTPKKVFVLGVYASAVHARWKGRDGREICKALAVASEPRIFWDGNEEEARKIISKIKIPKELGTLEPAEDRFSGPSAKALDDHILKPWGYTRDEAWLCDLLPETRLNPRQLKAVDRYNNFIEENGQNELNKADIPECPNIFCDQIRCEEILEELRESQAELLVLLGDEPIRQFLRKVADVDFKKLQEYVDKYGYGNSVKVDIDNRTIEVIPFTHPRNIAKLGLYSPKWHNKHSEWEESQKNKNKY